MCFEGLMVIQDTLDKHYFIWRLMERGSHYVHMSTKRPGQKRAPWKQKVDWITGGVRFGQLGPKYTALKQLTCHEFECSGLDFNTVLAILFLASSRKS